VHSKKKGKKKKPGVEENSRILNRREVVINITTPIPKKMLIIGCHQSSNDSNKCLHFYKLNTSMKTAFNEASSLDTK
jgi:hypothetical protein